VATAPVRFGAFLVDHSGTLRYVVGAEENQDTVTMRREGDKWVEVHRASMGDSRHLPQGFDPENKLVYTQISEKGEPAKLYAVDAETDEKRLLSSNGNVEAGAYLYSIDGLELLAVTYL